MKGSTEDLSTVRRFVLPLQRSKMVIATTLDLCVFSFIIIIL